MPSPKNVAYDPRRMGPRWVKDTPLRTSGPAGTLLLKMRKRKDIPKGFSTKTQMIVYLLPMADGMEESTFYDAIDILWWSYNRFLSDIKGKPHAD